MKKLTLSVNWIILAAGRETREGRKSQNNEISWKVFEITLVRVDRDLGQHGRGERCEKLVQLDMCFVLF